MGSHLERHLVHPPGSRVDGHYPLATKSVAKWPAAG